MDVVFEGLVSLVDWHCCDGLLLVLNAGPSKLVYKYLYTILSKVLTSHHLSQHQSIQLPAYPA